MAVHKHTGEDQGQRAASMAQDLILAEFCSWVQAALPRSFVLQQFAGCCCNRHHLLVSVMVAPVSGLGGLLAVFFAIQCVLVRTAAGCFVVRVCWSALLGCSSALPW